MTEIGLANSKLEMALTTYLPTCLLLALGRSQNKSRGFISG